MGNMDTSNSCLYVLILNKPL